MSPAHGSVRVAVVTAGTGAAAGHRLRAMSGQPQRTHYQVLGIPESASADEVRRAHRQLAQVLHPDRQAGSSPAEQSLAERRMREVNAAWTALSDPQRRAAYDRSLRAARTGPVSASASATATAATGPMASRFIDDEPAYGPSAEVDPDEPDLPAAQFWLLRRGPVVAALVVGVVVFIVTAYAGGDRTATRPVSSAGCVRVVAADQVIRINCLEQNDGTIVGQASEKLGCPSRSRGVLVTGEQEFQCVQTDVSRDGLPLNPSTSTAPPTTAGEGA